MKIPALEIRRKIFHVIANLLFAFGLYKEIINIREVFILLAVTLGVSIAYKSTRKRKKPLFATLFNLIERKQNMRTLPGKSVITPLVAALLGLLLYQREFVVVGFIILAIGDPLSYFFGRLGRIKIPWNPGKQAEGPLVAALITAAILSLHYPFTIALLVCSGTMLVESFPEKLTIIDDNFFIPLIAAALLTLLV